MTLPYDFSVLFVTAAALWAVIEFGVRWLFIAMRASTGGDRSDD